MKRAIVAFVFCILAGKAIAAATCNDPKVKDDFKMLYLCQLVNCQGLQTHGAEFWSWDREKIKQAVASMPNIKKFEFPYILEGVVGAQCLVASMNPVPDQFDRDLKKYTCVANLQFDPGSAKKSL